MSEPTFVETPLDKAQRELREATKIYEDAEQESRVASRKATESLNRLNAKQKAFDIAVADMRKTAPGQSDWKQRLPARAMSETLQEFPAGETT